jgi:putative methionine-R-sulfoxide reductase with GAF domain
MLVPIALAADPGLEFVVAPPEEGQMGVAVHESRDDRAARTLLVDRAIPVAPRPDEHEGLPVPGHNGVSDRVGLHRSTGGKPLNRARRQRGAPDGWHGEVIPHPIDCPVVNTEVMEEVVERLFARDRFDWVGVYLLEGDTLVLGPFRGPNPAGHERIPFGEGVCGTVAARGKTEVVPDVNARPGHIQCFLTTKSEVVAPIFKDGSVIGVLDIDSDSPDAFGEREVELVERAAVEIGTS